MQKKTFVSTEKFNEEKINAILENAEHKIFAEYK